jgi:GntR family transcriptional regulator
MSDVAEGRRRASKARAVRSVHRDRLPSEATLIQHYGVARMTVRQAIQELRTEGRVVAEHGRGVFVQQPAPVRRLASDRFLRRHRDAGQAAFLAEADNSGVRPRADQIEVTKTAPPELDV